jgi:hypothetical protein
MTAVAVQERRFSEMSPEEQQREAETVIMAARAVIDEARERRRATPPSKAKPRGVTSGNRLSRVTERASGKLDERIPDGLPISEVAVTKPAEARQVADRSR